LGVPQAAENLDDSWKIATVLKALRDSVESGIFRQREKPVFCST